MTREEAIDIIKCLAWHTRPNEEDIEQAIKALEQEPSGNAVSRRAVIDCFKKWQPYMATRLHEFEKELFELPSVNPQEPIGHWIYDYTSADGHKTYHCSKCGCYLQPKHSEPLSSFKWCSLCGARMVEPQEGVIRNDTN